MVKDIIPRPSVLRQSNGNGGHTARGASIGQILLSSNILSAQAFKEFKVSIQVHLGYKLASNLVFEAFVRQTATECLPDTLHKHNEYDAVLWRGVLDRVVQEYPILKQCARLWPVDAYYDIWVTNGRYRTNWLTKKRDSVATNSGGVERRSVKLGAEPVARKRTPMKRESLSAHVENMVDPIKREEYGPSISFQSKGSVSQLHYTPNIVARARTYPEACFSCGAYPHIIEEDRLELMNFLAINNLTDMAPALGSFGILHDGHFEILMSLSNSDRDKIISGMSRFLARPDMVELRKHLNSAAGFRNMLISSHDDSAHQHGTDFYSHTSRIFQCPLHHFTGPYSPKLLGLLRPLKLEMLVPVATTAYGITSDVQFDRVCGFSVANLDYFIEIGDTKLSFFHQRLLHLALQKAASRS